MVRDSLENKCDATGDARDDNVEESVSENDEYCDAINHFTNDDEKEELANIDKINNNETNKNRGRKCLIRGLSEEIFLYFIACAKIFFRLHN